MKSMRSVDNMKKYPNSNKCLFYIKTRKMGKSVIPAIPALFVERGKKN